MNAIDWTKPLQTVRGAPVTLLRILNTTASRYKYLVMYEVNGSERVVICDADGTPYPNVRAPYSGSTAALHIPIINVPEPFRLYGKAGAPGGGWYNEKQPWSTHVIELSPDDLKRVMRPLVEEE